MTYSRIPRRIWGLLIAVVLLVLAGMIISHQVYNRGLRPVSASQQTTIVTVPQGSTVKQIATQLEEEKLIRSAWAFQLYVHSEELNDQLQAGTYALSPSQGTKAIVKTLTSGKVTTRLVTILPGRRIDQVRADLINYGFLPEEVDKALDPAGYTDLPVLAFKPSSVNTLEGLLWPDSFQKDDATSASDIVRQSLAAMGQRLTPEVQAAFAAQGLTTYDGLKLTSIIIQEVGKASDQAQVAQVFLKRLKSGIKLESDATARYGAVAAGRAPSLTYNSPYNTYTNAGLPPTPISTINSTSLAAAINPAPTDWQYFVSGDDGTTYFSKTLMEHEALTRQHCRELCGN
jgi:UPF0755 protein